jgi:[ribosomal protein S5]-alanine N-acetyltransferase
MLTPDFHPFPLLITKRLCLRKIGPEDELPLFELRSSSTVMKYIDRPLVRTRADAVQLIEMMVGLIDSNEGLSWAITRKEDPGMIGTVHLWKISRENHRAEIGYLLHPAHQGKGIMHETLEAVINHGFAEIGLHSIEANVNPGNIASIGLLERCGFTGEAYFKENYFFNGKFLDSAVYTLLTPIKG